MRTRSVSAGRYARRGAAAISAIITWLVFDALPAAAQIFESDVDAQPGTTETTQLVTSSTEVRRAVIGLLAVAALSGLLFIVYWYVTGQQARERYARQYGGRHAVRPREAGAPTPRPVPVSVDGHQDHYRPAPPPPGAGSLGPRRRRSTAAVAHEQGLYPTPPPVVAQRRLRPAMHAPQGVPHPLAGDTGTYGAPRR